MQSASGMLRIAVKPQFNLLVSLAQAAGVGGYVYLFRTGWLGSHRQLGGYSFVLAAGLAASLWFQLSGAEEIEFDGQQQVLRVRRSGLRWPRVSEYPLDSVSALETRYGYDDRDAEPDGLCCRVGNLPVSFAKGLNAEQADKVLAELQSAFPDLAHRLLTGKEPFGDHFTTLKLN